MMIKVNGETTKYYKYESSGSGRVTIPLSLAKALNWEHDDELNVIVEVFNEQKGLFFFKKDKE